MSDKLQELKRDRDELFNKAVNQDPLNDDIVAIETELDPDACNYNSYASRFKLKMNLRDITFTGIYEDFKSTLHFTCGKCEHVWDGKATRAQQDGCPKCKQFDIDIEKTIKMWNRSKKIIRDKSGVIIQYPEKTKVAMLGDEFILRCERNHNFTFTHLKLRDNQWCPVCKELYGNEVEDGAAYTYNRGVTKEDKFETHCKIAEIKGAKIMSINPETGAFKIICIYCNRTMTVTPRQLCNNQYLCKAKCYKGHRYSVNGDIGV